MKEPNLPSFSDSWPLPQDGQARASPPSSRGREDVRRQDLVQRIEHIGDAQFLDVFEGGREVLPEVAQHVLPVDLAGRDLVELLLEIGGEVIFHIAAEEAFEEGGDDAALVLGDEALLVEPHIAAVAQRLEDRDIGRGPADAEFFQLLDERGFRIARRRLGEMLHALDLLRRRSSRRAPWRAGGGNPRPRRRRGSSE